MAAASHLDIASSERKSSFGVAKPSAWAPHPLTMHLTRPKSAKGRTRPHLQYSQSVEVYSSPVPSSLQPLLIPTKEIPSGRRASLSQPLYQPAPVVPTEILDLLHQVPVRTSSSLNKYRVLPSISRKELSTSGPEGMSGQAGQGARVEKEEDQSLKGCSLMEKVSSQRGPKGGSGESKESPRLLSKAKPLSKTRGDSPLPALNLEEPSAEEPRLLLAIRSPSGQRFERYFRPTDSLKTVLVVAAQKNSAAYRHCSIETMEVPRRSFSDLSKSLAECAIPHKSVLCILQEERDGDLKATKG